MNDEIRQFITPILKDATDDQLKKIGFAAFGSNYSYLSSERKELLDEFQKELELADFSSEDRERLKYIVDYVESFNESPQMAINNNLTMNRNKFDDAPTIESIIEYFN